MPPEISYRIATDNDAGELAVLRQRWSPPAVPHSDLERDHYAAHLRQWMRSSGDRSVCAVASFEGDFIGMAWLAVFDRVPNPDSFVRLSGDIQSVYVVPEQRGLGVATRMVEMLVEIADARGIASISADSSEQALAFYHRLGFRRSLLLLQRKLVGSLPS